MTWKRLDVSPDAAATLKTAFAETFERAGQPRNAALFEVAAESGMQLYLSPGASALFEATLKAVAKKGAGAPPPGAQLVVGDPATWGRR
ncbi:MAG: hypothetical protein AB7I36_05260 [Rhodospirillaceae bacterium]